MQPFSLSHLARGAVAVAVFSPAAVHLAVQQPGGHAAGTPAAQRSLSDSLGTDAAAACIPVDGADQTRPCPEPLAAQPAQATARPDEPWNDWVHIWQGVASPSESFGRTVPAEFNAAVQAAALEAAAAEAQNASAQAPVMQEPVIQDARAGNRWAWQARHLARRIDRLANELEDLGQFELSDELRSTGTRVRFSEPVSPGAVLR